MNKIRTAVFSLIVFVMLLPILPSSAHPADTSTVYLPIISRSCLTPAFPLQNGGFELGKVAWIESDTVTWPIIMQGGAHTGTWLAVFNSQGGTHSISQTVTVPECAPKLGVWWKTENTGYGRVHSFNIKVNDVTVGELWEPMIPSDEWCNMTVDLSAYENQTILLSFEKYIGDRGGWTNFYVDDITFQDKVTGSGCEFFEK